MNCYAVNRTCVQQFRGGQERLLHYIHILSAMTIFSLSEVDHTALLETLVSATSTNPSDISANDVGYQLESSLDELKNVLVIPPKSDASRQQVKTGELRVCQAGILG